jgi:hypothetical protein
MESFLSPKTEIKKSKIEGSGLFTIKPIKKGEIIGIKGGHVFDRSVLDKIKKDIGDSYFQISDNFFIGPLSKDEIKESMMFLNHCCEPNVGVEGNIVFIALRDIHFGEELTIDYAMTDGDNYELECNCGVKGCRKVITGKDWMNKELQKKYNGYFSAYLQKKINNLSSAL